MTATAHSGAGDGSLKRSQAGEKIRLGQVARLLVKPGVFGRVNRAMSYLWQHGPAATRAMILHRLGAPPHYEDWIETYDSISPEARVRMRRRADHLADPPLFTLIAAGEAPDPEAVASLLAAAQSQIHTRWELVVAAPAGALAAVAARIGAMGIEPRLKLAPIAAGEDPTSVALTAAGGDISVICGPGYEPREHALLLVAERLAAHPDADIVYWDEDEIDPGETRREPWFKPDWNPDLNLAQDLLGGAVAFRTAAVRRAGGLRPAFGPAAVFDLGLRLAEAGGPDRIEHIPHVLFHRRGAPPVTTASTADALDARRRAVAEHLSRRGVAATATTDPTTGSVRVDYALTGPEPLVSIIIPTTDRIDLLKPCLAGLMSGTDYTNFEVIVVDCASVEPATAEWLARAAEDPRMRVIRREGTFNYSAANNLAAREAKGEILLLLNNDTEVIRPNWLTQMVANLQRPEVGAVGAKLLYLNGGVQHAGMCFQEGETLHAGLGLTREDAGYKGQVALPRAVSAVTGACLAVRRATFEQVGGLDENLRVAFNDVDLCLRIRQLGLLIVWTPYAELYHHESATGGLDRSLARRLEGRRERRITQRHWDHAMRSDPFHSPNLAVWDGRESPAAPAPFGPGCGLAFPPRVARTW